VKTRQSYLLIGYNGAGNTGSDIRTSQIVEDLLSAAGPEICISVVSLNPNWTESPHGNHIKVLVAKVWLLPIQIVWWVLRHNVIMLIEGSTFKESWSSLLLRTYLWTAFVAILLQRRAIAYCVDVGALSRFNRLAVVWVCNRLTAVIVRSDAARQRLMSWGVLDNVHVSADPVLRYKGEPVEPLTEIPTVNEHGLRTVGLAPIEFYQWPVRVKLFGPRFLLYRWPLYFSWDKLRSTRSAEMVRQLAAICRYILTECDCRIRLIAMEPVDDRICHRIVKALAPEHQERITLLTRKTHSCRDLLSNLRSLDALVTARYHAAVIALTSAVPQVAIYHDERLAELYRELDIYKDCAVSFNDQNLETALLPKLEWCLKNRLALRVRIRGKLESTMVPRSASAIEILRSALTAD
jgi:polysaccharide pyruvyl transferase WcaK-like protein